MNDATHDGGRIESLVTHWIASWNARDLAGVLSHWAEDATFASPYVVDFVGRPCLTGKAELESYWRTGLERIQHLHFELQEFSWDPQRRIVVILYLQTANGHTRHACEVIHLNEDGLGVKGNALYGAPVAVPAAAA